MRKVKMALQNRLMVESSDEHIDVSVRDVEKAIMKLKSMISDGSEGLESDHIIQGTDTLNSIITVLICLIMVHGYVPVLINRSVIIAIPKDKRASLRDSTNDRGITLCNDITKVLDI